MDVQTPAPWEAAYREALVAFMRSRAVAVPPRDAAPFLEAARTGETIFTWGVAGRHVGRLGAVTVPAEATVAEVTMDEFQETDAGNQQRTYVVVSPVEVEGGIYSEGDGAGAALVWRGSTGELMAAVAAAAKDAA